MRKKKGLVDIINGKQSREYSPNSHEEGGNFPVVDYPHSSVRGTLYPIGKLVPGTPSKKLFFPHKFTNYSLIKKTNILKHCIGSKSWVCNQWIFKLIDE